MFENLVSGEVIFLTTSYARKVPLPGVTIHCLKGHAALPDDAPIMGIYQASIARAFLENLKISRGASQLPKVLPRSDLEQRLDAYLKSKGEDGLNALRDQARVIAPTLGMTRELAILEKIISALLGSHSSAVLTTPIARATSQGNGYDVHRLELFHVLATSLRTYAATFHPDTLRDLEAIRARAFFDAYFSNYIEGTRFSVEEARIIAFENRIPKHRPEGKDIAGTFQLMCDQEKLVTTFRTADEFLSHLCECHALIMTAHPEKGPGRFKWENNYAGNTAFVDKKQVEGTLREGFQILSTLESGFIKAAFMMFMLTEVHPFMDGNGRIARAMMNAELLKAKESPIIIVTNYREDYLGALRKLSRQSMPDAYLRMLTRAHDFTAGIDFSNYQTALANLREKNAFAEPGDGTLQLS